MKEHNTDTLSQHSFSLTSKRRILFLQALFVLGFVLALVAEQFFTLVVQDLDQTAQNARARVFLSEQMLKDIDAIEVTVYQMVTALDKTGYQRHEAKIAEAIDHIKQSLDVLRFGGKVTRTFVVKHDVTEMLVKHVSYVADKDQAYVADMIDMGSMLDDLLLKTTSLSHRLAELGVMQARVEKTSALFDADIRKQVSQLPPLLVHLKENGGRLTLEAQYSLNKLNQALKQQKQRYEVAKVAFMLVVLLLMIGLAWWFTRQISQSNQQLALAWQSMQASQQEAERASRAKSDFVSRMSHELRTPLNAILGFTQILAMEQLPEHQQNAVQHIHRSGQHLLDLINQVLDIAKIEAGKLELEALNIDLPQLIQDTAAITGERARAKKLIFDVILSEDLPRYILGDPTRIRQVLINLIGNAIKFTNQGSITVIARLTPDQANHLRIEVVDTGIGMSVMALSRLFKPFAQADGSITRQFGGTGLGLVLCKELVEAMGGEIHVDSHIGHGSRFWFDLPFLLGTPSAELLKVVVPPQASESTASAGMVVTSKLSRIRLLLVEDNPVNQMVAMKFLNKLAIKQVSLAHHGEEALEKLAQSPYDVVLLDMEMPVMDGYTTLSKIREQELYNDDLPHQLVIAMSANALNEDKQRAFDLGIDDYITKPVNFAVLQATLEKWLLR